MDNPIECSVCNISDEKCIETHVQRENMFYKIERKKVEFCSFIINLF